MPLSLVTRLEEVDARDFQHSGGRTLLHYRNRLMPIVPVGDSQIRQEGLQPLVIISEGELTMALAVDAIIDIVEELLDVEIQETQDRSVIGSAVIRGRATDIIDLAHYLPQGDPGWLSTRRAENQPASGAHILLLEPSDFLREMLNPVLKASGQPVLLAGDHDTARRLVLQGGIGTLLIDLDRDPETSLALAVDLRATESGRQMRILGMTTLATPELHMRAMHAQLDEVVAKFDRRALLRELGERKTTVRLAA